MQDPLAVVVVDSTLIYDSSDVTMWKFQYLDSCFKDYLGFHFGVQKELDSELD